MVPQPTEELFHVLNVETLSVCYEALSSIDKYDINEKHLPELTKLLQFIVIRTEAYACTVTSDSKDSALKMKENFDKFQQKFSYNNKEISAIKTKLENSWKIVKQIFDISLKSKSIVYEKHSNDVASAIEWFNKNPCELFNDTKRDHIENIKETLQNTTVNYYFVDKFPQFIYKSITLLNTFYDNQDLLKWKRKLYIYDNGKKCCTAFFIEDKAFDTYFVDHYGNIYLSEIQFLQALRKFYGYYDFTDLTGTIYNVKLIYDEDFLKIILKSFQKYLCIFHSFYDKTSFRINQGAIFSNFAIAFEDNEEQAIEILKKLKIFSSFFFELNSCSKNDVILSMINREDLRISLNLGHIIINTKTLLDNFDQFKKHLNDLNLSKISYETPYSNIVVHIMVPFGVKLNAFPLEVYQKQINKRAKVREDGYVNICHYITAKIVEHLQKINLMKERLKWVHLKYIYFWVAEKYKHDMDVINEFEQNEQNVKKEFCNLLKAIDKCEKSNIHRFSNNFAAAYNFSAHYNSICEALLANNYEFVTTCKWSSEIPALNEKNLNECATFYLKYLPDFLFDRNFCVKTFNTEPSNQNAVKKWSLFETCSVKGIICTLQSNGSTFIRDLCACAARETFDFDNDSGVGSSAASSDYGSDIEEEMKYLNYF